MDACKSLSTIISEAIASAKEQPVTRENSCVITKLQEALMWHKEDLQTKADIAQKALRGSGAPHHSQR